jgi:hypothetical protein
MNTLCYTVVLGKPAGENIGVIKQGESGYYKMDYNFGDKAEEIVDMLNERLGVSKEVRLAMELGSLFGWNIPACDILKQAA